MKRTLSLLLALVMILSMVPFSAFAEEAQTNTLNQLGEITAELDGSEEGVTYTWTAPDTGTLTITMPSDAENGWEYAISSSNSNLDNSGTIYDSEGYDSSLEDWTDVVVDSQSIEVTEGDEISIYVNTCSVEEEDSGEYVYPEGTVVFTVSFESALGSESQPIELLDNDTTDGAIITADITVPASKTLYYSIARVQGVILTVTGEGSFTVNYGEESVAAADGVATIEGVSAESMYAPALISVQNTGDAELSAQVKLTFPLGDYSNPEVIEKLGSLTAALEEGDTDGYYYKWTAEKNGTLSFQIDVPKAELVADIVLTKMSNSLTASLSGEGVETVFGDELTYTAVSMEVAAGDVIYVAVSAIPVENHYAAMDVTFSSTFTAPAGTEDNPILLATEDTLTVAAGATVYCRNKGNVDGMILTLSGGAATVAHNDATYTAVDGVTTLECEQSSTNDPAWFVITNTGSQTATYTVSFSALTGTLANPAVLKLDTPTTATVAAGTEGYYYSWTATEPGVFTVTVDTENAANGWFYSIYNTTKGVQTESHVSGDSPLVPSDSVSVAAGDVVRVIVNTYKASRPYNAPAGSVTITASFSSGEVSDDNSGEGVQATPDDPILVEYTAVTDGTLSVVISGTSGYKIEVFDADSNTVGLPTKSSTGAEQTLTYALKAGQYTIRMVGYADYEEASGEINYEISFAAAETGDGDEEKAAYEISETALTLGDNTLTLLDTAETTIYGYKPTETGVYTFTAPVGAILGYWGAGSWFLTDPNSTTNTYEWTCTSVGQTAYIGVSGVEGEFNLNVAKTGDYEVVEISTVTYENKAELSAFTLPACAALGGYVDVYGDTHTAVLGDDGYYHLDSADGDILLIDMDYQDIILSAALNSDRPVMYAYVTGEDGSQVRYDIGAAVQEYEAVTDSEGYYPLTEDLIFFYDVYTASAGTWSFYLTEDGYNEDCVWMYCCRTMTVVHDYVDGTCSICGATDPDYATGSIRLRGATLELKEMIRIIYMASDGLIPTDDENVAERGVLLYDSAEKAATRDIAQAYETIILEWDATEERYVGVSEGISARNMGNSQFAVAYLKLANGNYIFGTNSVGEEQTIEYSPVIYCKKYMDSSDTKVANLCRAILHYGAAAQVAQDGKTTGLMNEGVEPIPYDESVLGETVFSADTAVTNGMKLRGATMELKGAISYIVMFTAEDTNLSDKQLYAEYELQYESGTKTGNVELVYSVEDDRLLATISGVPAKDMGATLKVRPYYVDDNGDKQYGGELVYSGYEYVRRALNSTSYTEAVKDLAKALAMYIYYANQYGYNK